MTTGSTVALGGPPVKRDAASSEFFDAAASGKLLIQRCNTCKHMLASAATACTVCQGTDLSAHRSHGTGQLVTWAVVHLAPHPAFATEVPFVTGIVELSEGPWLRTRILATAPELLAAGLVLRLSFAHSQDGETYPVFVPDDESPGPDG